MKKFFFVVFACLFFIFFAFPNKNPQRIVSLVPAITETIFAVGAENSLVARTDFCTFPAQAMALPSVGGFDGKAISFEKIIAFSPDLVCLAKGMHDHLINPLKSRGIQVFVSSAENLNDILDEIKSIAELTGRLRQGELCLSQIESQIECAKTLANSTRKKRLCVYWEVSAKPYFTCGKKSFVTDLLKILGAENIFSDIDQSYPQVSEESIVSRMPQMIVFPAHAKNNKTNFILERKNWKNIPAVAQGKVFAVDGDLFSRPGPRIGQMAMALAEILVRSGTNP